MVGHDACAQPSYLAQDVTKPITKIVIPANAGTQAGTRVELGPGIRRDDGL